MTEKYDFKKEWPNIKKKLMAMSQEAMQLARKGEEEVIRFSKKSKLHIDVTTVALRREKLFYQIGKEYVRSKCPGQQSVKMKEILAELNELKKEERALKRKIKPSDRIDKKA